MTQNRLGFDALSEFDAAAIHSLDKHGLVQGAYIKGGGDFPCFGVVPSLCTGLVACEIGIVVDDVDVESEDFAEDFCDGGLAGGALGGRFFGIL